MGEVKKIENVDIDLLIPYAKNAKIHDKKQIEKIKASIQEFGFVSPCLIDKDFNIIAGHGRVLAAKELKFEKLPCVFIEGLTDSQRRAYILADNRLSELGEWDFELVVDELEILKDENFDISITGFDLDKINVNVEVEDDNYNESDIEERCKPGDLWKLGNHKLICGDSSDVLTISNLLGGGRADLVFTDPPYKMGYSGAGIIREKTKNVRERIKDIIDFDANSIGYLAAMDIGSIYIFTSKDLIPDYLQIFKEWKFNILTWVKTNSPPMCNNNFLPDIEYLLYFHKGKRIWNNGLKPMDIYRRAFFSSRAEGHAEIGDVHPTMKPLKLISDKMQISSNKNSIVLDLFGGSGTTLIVCEQLERCCYMCEIEPHYCDVIIDRWEKYTGQKAELINR
jgi:DNA modification methylase